MQYITTTELRTRSTELIELLKSGATVKLVHRSKVVGTIAPKEKEVKKFDPKGFLKAARKLNLPYLTDKQIETRYRKYMNKRHGKGIS